MMRQTRIRMIAVLAACHLSSGCGRSDAVAQSTPLRPYERPAGWSSECFGRLVMDVPGRLELGEATPEYYEPTGGAIVASYGRANADLFEGRVSIAGLMLTESSPIDFARFDRLLKQVDYQYTKGWTVNTLMSDAEMRQIRKATERTSPSKGSYIWRQRNDFDFGALVEADARVRLLRGKLSGEGSMKQAAAVIDAVWPRYRPRRAQEMPSGPGICTPYGFLADPATATERDYELDFAVPDQRHSNLAAYLRVSTHSQAMASAGLTFKTVPVEDRPTPWDEDDAQAKKSKETCKPQQGTASRDLFGCMFAGARAIKSHRPVEFLTLANGQRARLVAYEFYPAINDGYEYAVQLEAQGVPDSATQPNIELTVYGIGHQSKIPSMQGKEPPPLDEAIATVRTIAASLRLRPGAVAEGAPVKDTLEGVR